MLQRYRQTLLSLLAYVNLICQAPERRTIELLWVQEELFSKIVYVETRIKRMRARISSLKRALVGRPTKDEAAKIKRDIERANQQIDQYGDLIYLLRSIGDALAAIYFSGWPLRHMSLKEHSGFLSGKEGSRIERRVLRLFNKDNIPAIMCDLTNSLRYGDIVASAGRVPRVFEVKIKRDSGSKGRLHRQRAGMERVNEYFFSDRGVNIFGLEEGARIIRSTKHSLAEYRWLAVREAITTAYQFGCCMRELEPGMRLLACMDSVPSPESLHEMMDGVEKAYVAGLNSIRFDIVGHTPFALSLFDPNHVLDFYENRLSLVVVIDISRVERTLAQAGYTDVAFPNVDGVFCTANNGRDEGDADRQELIIGQHFFHRVTIEFLSLRWFMDEVLWKRQIATPKSISLHD